MTENVFMSKRADCESFIITLKALFAEVIYTNNINIYVSYVLYMCVCVCVCVCLCFSDA